MSGRKGAAMATSAKATGNTAYTMLTARVPKGVKERGDALLRSMGSTPTKLVNAAYAFLLEHRELPGAGTGCKALKSGPRTLNSQQAQQLSSIMETLAVGSGRSPKKTYEQLREEAMAERFPEYLKPDADNR